MTTEHVVIGIAVITVFTIMFPVLFEIAETIIKTIKRAFK